MNQGISKQECLETSGDTFDISRYSENGFWKGLADEYVIKKSEKAHYKNDIWGLHKTTEIDKIQNINKRKIQ